MFLMSGQTARVTSAGGVNLVSYCSFEASVINLYHEILTNVKCFSTQARWRSMVQASEGATHILYCVSVSRDQLDEYVCTFSPSSLTTSGTLSSSSRQALVMPLAMMAQLTIPPKMLTRMASTCEARQWIKWLSPAAGGGEIHLWTKSIHLCVTAGQKHWKWEHCISNERWNPCGQCGRCTFVLSNIYCEMNTFLPKPKYRVFSQGPEGLVTGFTPSV